MKKRPLKLRPYGPGKFSTVLDSRVYDLSLNGCDAEYGDVTTIGEWYGILHGLQVDGPFADFTPGLTPDEITFLRRHRVGCIVREDDQGFVDVEYFTNKRTLARAEREIEAQIARMEGIDHAN